MQFAEVTLSGGRLNLLGALKESSDLADCYQIAVEAGNTLWIETATPGDGPHHFVNQLDPAIELYDPDGTLVAADDNSAPDGRNAQLTHEASVSGTYLVQVFADFDRGGEYVLTVAGHGDDAHQRQRPQGRNTKNTQEHKSISRYLHFSFDAPSFGRGFFTWTL